MSAPSPILFTIPNFTTAGSGRAMLNIVERLDRRRFAPAVCAARRGGRLEAEIDRMGIPYLEAPVTVAARPLATLALRARRAAQVFRPYGFALWHSFHYLDDYTEPLVARFAGAKGWIYTKKNMNWGRRSWLLRTLLARRVAAQNTDMLRDFFSSPLFRKKAVLVPRGVDTQRFRPGLPRLLSLREKLGVAPATVVIGCVAHLVPVKRHPALLEALAGVPGAQLWLAGKELDADYAAALRRQIREANLETRVSFLGDVQDIPSLLAEIDVFALVGRTEGSPVALLEAMSSGVPCVATDVSGVRDIVEPDHSGILVPPSDADALARALARLAGDSRGRREMGEAARARVCERYAIEIEVRAHEDLYDSILGRAAGARRAA